jgi:hypothetical protein
MEAKGKAMGKRGGSFCGEGSEKINSADRPETRTLKA